MGALVGAAYAAGELDHLEQWVLGLGIKDIVAFMDVSLGGGLVKGERLIDFFRHRVADRPIEQLAIPFAAIATALHIGAEIWLRHGPTLDAVRASIALPGSFEPVLKDGIVLVDGGLVGPVPFDMVVLNELDRFHPVMDVIDRLPQLGARGAYLQQALRDTLIEHKQYFCTHGDDVPEIAGWRWGQGRQVGTRATSTDGDNV